MALRKAYTKEIIHRWLIPVKQNSVLKIKRACIIPLGVATQFTVDDNEFIHFIFQEFEKVITDYQNKAPLRSIPSSDLEDSTEVIT